METAGWMLMVMVIYGYSYNAILRAVMALERIATALEKWNEQD